MAARAHLLFDLDGTLTDPREGIVRCIEHALVGLECAVPPESQLVRYIGPPLRRTFAELLGPQRQDEVETAVALYRQRFTETGIYENAVYPGIVECLERLRERGATLYVATSKPQTYAERIVAHFGLASHFKAVHGSELDGERSDKADLIAHVMEREGFSGAEAAMVGDRMFDMRGAGRHGLFAVGVLWGYGTRSELRTAGADAICVEPGQLAAVLG